MNLKSVFRIVFAIILFSFIGMLVGCSATMRADHICASFKAGKALEVKENCNE